MSIMEWWPGSALLLILLSHLGGFGGAQEENDLNSHQPFKINVTALQQFPSQCTTHCKDQLQYNSICLEGCREWRRGLREGCGVVCVGREANFREFHACQVGCSKVIEDYYFYLSGVLGTPEPPALVSSSLEHNSLELTWEGIQGQIPHLLFIVQKRVLPRNQDWEALPMEPFNATQVDVDGLRPYTEYQFRVGWIIAQDFPPVYSSESIRIVTLAKGYPNAPQITSIQPITNTSVSITWLPPSQPNGPLIAYILKLQNVPNGHLILKEIPIVGHHTQGGFTFSALSPNTNYSLAISGINREGEGDATRTTFFTPQSQTSNDISKTGEPKLLIQGIREVYVQAIDLLRQPEVSVFISTKNVTGMSAHFRKNLVFIATGEGDVIRRSLGPGNETRLILPRDKIDLQVTFLSVDWLHDHLYLVGKKKRSETWVIRRTDLNGANIRTVLRDIGSKPVDFQADPYTGYLYWVSSTGVGSSRVAGLYRLDLYQREESPSGATPLLEEEGLGPFTIDFANYRILVVHRTRNTVLSVSLDGEKSDIRGNTQSPNWAEVVSIGNYGGVFYWTTGQSIVVEEFNSVQNTFYHNSYEVAKSHQPCSRLLLVHPSLQPTPAPMAPPPHLQAVFAQRKARLTWKPPPQIAGLGEGSWRRWNYEVTLNQNVTFSQINETELLIDVQPNTEYSMQVLAYSESGRSPWSVPFKGHSLEDKSNLTLLWASDSGRIYSTDPIGDALQPILFKSSSDAITSLAASPTAIFYALANGSAFEYLRATAETRPLAGVQAHTLAYEPVGQKLYWSNPKKQAILRRSLILNDTETPEYLPLLTTALEIALDSRRGLIVWTNGHSVEVARLNGRHQRTVATVGLFSGVRILSISIDTHEQSVYWLTRKSTGSTLYKKSYRNYADNQNHLESDSAIVVGNFEDSTLKGPIRYLSGRIIVLSSGSEALIQELKAPHSRADMPLQSIANVSSLLVSCDEVHLPAIQPPPAVLPWSITITGNWELFTINWQSVSHSKTVFYDVVINGFNFEPTSQPSLRIDNRNGSVLIPYLKPYAEIEISVTAATFWSSAKSSVVKRRTPSAKPSTPRNPRFFIRTLKYPYIGGNSSEELVGELRWDTPAEANGLILGYLVHCWKGSRKSSDTFLQVDLRKLSAQVSHLSRATVYHFAIQAYTDGGVGRMSRKIEVDTERGQILSKLLITAGDQVEVLDVDRNGVERLRTPYSPHTVTYYELEDTVFCFEEGKHLFKSTLKGTNKTRILSLRESVASNLAVNWISRKLYWVGEATGRRDEFTVEMLDLERIEDGPQEIVASTNHITALTLNPFTSSIVWTSVSSSGVTSLLTALDDGSSLKPFLSSMRSCNCSQIGSVGEGLSLDVSSGRGIVFMQPSVGLIWLADEDGCACRPLVNSSGTGRPLRLSADSGHVYWVSNQGHASDGLYAGDKSGLGVTQLRTAIGPRIREVSSIGHSLQPFPERSCLIPIKLEVDEAILLNRSAHSITLRLPPPEYQNCSLENLTLPSPSYVIYYARLDEQGLTPCTTASVSRCQSISNATSPAVIEDLEPYTSYTLFFSVFTYYMNGEGFSPIFSAPVVMATAPGAPLPPTLLALTPRTPTSISVRWAEPEKRNGRKIWYAVEWERVGSKGTPNQIWAAAEGAYVQNDTELSLNVTKLKPARKYSVWVVAYSELGDEFSKSEVRQIETLGAPNDIRLLKATPHQITVTWTAANDTRISKHEFVFREGWSADWNETGVQEGTCGGCTYNMTVGGLKSKTMYGFRLRTWYAGDPSEYFVWPTEMQFKMETLADKPSPPGIPILRGIGHSRYEVSWERSEENGGRVDMYSLEGRFKSFPANSSRNRTERGGVTVEPLPSNAEHRRKRDELEVAQKFVAAETSDMLEETLDWIVVYNGSECRWEVVGLDPRRRIEFRVRSRNVYGWSDYSRQTSAVTLAELVLVSEPQSLGTVAGVVFLGALTLAAFGLILSYAYRRQKKEKPSLDWSPSGGHRSEVELATLGEMPRGVHQNNILYAADLFLDFDAEALDLLKVKRNQLTLLTHLGSGAFGDVYEGYASNIRPIQSSSLGSRVAIKTLRKGASQKEKIQFVEEARLMGQFHHPNILELLGICLDADPCLILELMSGGDLLSHLRSTRLPQSNFAFDLLDLVEMAVQVARGCVYLEEKHFVHRDLAARNCLVRVDSLAEGGLERVVKIGDFGLARDVYRNDYYRKEGEGLLPVRWMPPESLMDGVFTTQSDVWSFGVLLWEILTLGNQPYPARSNVEVLNYVRMGGRLHQPPNSPPPLNWLMFRCWEFEPHNRPNFKECLQHLLTIAEIVSERVLDQQSEDAPPYQNTMSFSRENQERDNFDIGDADSPALPQYSSDSNEREPAESESHLPKYLEVVGNWREGEPPPSPCPPQLHHMAINDGYEIPLKPPSGGEPPSPHPDRLARHKSHPPYGGGPERRNLLASTTSEEDSADIGWTNDAPAPSRDTSSTNYGDMDCIASDERTSYAAFNQLHWKRPLRATD